MRMAALFNAFLYYSHDLLITSQFISVIASWFTLKLKYPRIQSFLNTVLFTKGRPGCV